jgi:glutamyl/glutaminyl-tRNA synthetase
MIWLWARQNDASILLRIDDLDKGRVRTEYIEEVFRTLDWLGIDWDVGPQTVDEFNSRWSQLQRIDEYNKAIQRLLDSKLAYHCRCSRVSWLKSGYAGCDCDRDNLIDNAETTLRLAVLPEILSFHDQWSGFLSWKYNPHSMVSAIRSRDGQPSYQIATIVDDVLFGVSHIMRGQDLIESTAFQKYLSGLIGMPQFSRIQFMHHPLVQIDGAKLSKSDGSTSLKHFRESGDSPEQFYHWVSKLMGTEPVTSIRELLVRVNLGTIPFSENQDW